MLKIKKPAKPIKATHLKHIARFSSWQMLIFVVMFGATGGYFILRGHAVSGSNVIATDGPNYNDSVALGPDGNPRISYTNTNGNLMLIHCLDTQCNSQHTSVVYAQGGSSHTSVAVGADGNARISYVLNQTLVFARCTDIDCTASVVSAVTSSEPVSTSLSVSSGSMALGSDGNARIIYSAQFPPYKNGLKFVHCTNADCTAKNISTVASPGANGTGAPANIASITPALSLDSQGYGSFAYFEEDYSQNPDWVSYIHCSNPDCSSFSSHHVWTDGGPASTTITQSISGAGGPFGSGQYSQVPDTRYFVVLGSGAVSVHFDYVYRNAQCANQLQVFKVDNTDGSIDGVLPDNSAWPAAVSSRNPQLVFDEGASSIGAGTDLAFQGGDILAFRLLGCGNYYYSFDQANPSQQAHMLTYQSTSGQPWQQDWEDGSDFDYNDMVVNITGVQGGIVTGVQGGSPLAPPVEAVSSAIGSDGNPDIAFIWERDLTKDSYVRFLHCQDPDCSSSSYSVVDNDNPGSLDAYHNGIALTLGSDNLARLAFTGSFNGESALKFIRCTNADCSTKIGPFVPVGTNTGHYSSMVLGSAVGVSDLPRLSYQDMGTGALEFAGCGDINCNTIGIPVPPPTAPADLTAIAASDTSIDLSWTASASPLGVASYDIYELGPAPDAADGDSVQRIDQIVGSTGNTNYQVSGLQAASGYGFYVVAKDTTGTASQPSNTAADITTGTAVNCVSSPKNRCLQSLAWPYKSPFGEDPKICKDTTVCRPMGAIITGVIDEGVDYAAVPGKTAPIYAMGNGRIVNVTKGELGGFGPTWIAYQLTGGPAIGLKVYVAEHCTLATNATKNVLSGKKLGRAWAVKDAVTANSVLCQMQPGSIEIGWANDNNQVLAAAYQCYASIGKHEPTQYGFSFSQFIFRAGGPRGLKFGYNGHLYPSPVHPCSDITQKYLDGSWYNYGQ